MELIISRLLTVPHGFPTRAGGVSTGDFTSLNASATVGDDPAAVEENLRRLAAAAKVDVSALATVNQVHGDVVIEARAQRTKGRATPPLADADALWTAEEGTAVGVKTADCLPILVEDPAGLRVAAVHAGWRGVISEILLRAIEQLSARGSKPADLRVAIGPSIQKCCFEVDEDLARRFAERFGQDVVVKGEGKPRLDLQRAVRLTALRAGVPESHVDSLPQCTFCDPGARFFSHRRERGHTGRHLSFISCAFGTRHPASHGTGTGL